MLNGTGTKIYFGTGNIDDWCVYIKEPCDVRAHAPLDKDYFMETLRLSGLYGPDKVYGSFKRVYDAVERMVWDNNHKTKCYRVCDGEAELYPGEDTLVLWLTYYMTMLAEEWKAGAVLGKRIKHLGVYNILYDGYSIEKTTTYMRNISGGWRQLKGYMLERGIY